jgi:aconitate hydratase
MLERLALTLDGSTYYYYDVSRYTHMPHTVRIILESICRNIDGKSITVDDLNTILAWDASNPQEVPFKVARVIMQDYTGVPALVDLAIMRDIAVSYGYNASIINPLVQVDLVIDHSVQVDNWGMSDAYILNHRLELERNKERYEFLKWASKAFKNLRIFPPGTGIIHQVNLEHISKVVMVDPNSRVAYFDSCLGMDSHTTMVNGLGVLAWGVGGIEAEAAMLGQPISIVPDVIGIRLYNKPKEGVTATDIVLTLTEYLRKHNDVVDKFIEFFGEGVDSLTVPDRATIANMAPEYGATTALFPVDEETIRYLKLTGRGEHAELVRAYYKRQGMFGYAKDANYSKVIEFDLSSVEPCIAGPSLPWERRTLSDAWKGIEELIAKRDKGHSSMEHKSVSLDGYELRDGSIVIAAITSCTNTSNPYLLLAAGLLAKKAYEHGLRVSKYVKTSLAPGSRVVEHYLKKTGLLYYLERLGFSIVGYGCTTCIGNSGPLYDDVSSIIKNNDIIAVAVLSGNRNFEGRIHPDVRANYLMSPPLVVAFALAGRVKDLSSEPIGYSIHDDNKPIYLKDIWPSSSELNKLLEHVDADDFKRIYSNIGDLVPEWGSINADDSMLYRWSKDNTFIQRAPFLDDFTLDEDNSAIEDIINARALLVLGDNITTDHISPAGLITPDSQAGIYLQEQGVNIARLNTFGARRGNWHVMVRGTFTGRLENKMLKAKGISKRGGYTIHYPSERLLTVYDAAMQYKHEGVPLIVIAGKNYGAGSSRDWAAKGPRLLGVRAIIAESFERIHRSNLICMGILPLQFIDADADSLGIDGSEIFDIKGLKDLKPRKVVDLIIRKGNTVKSTRLLVRIDTENELRYYMSKGILHYALKEIIRSSKQDNY